MGQPQSDNISIHDYLDIEREDKVRYEFHEGHLIRMAGGTLDHSTICNNVGAELRSLARANGSCVAFNSEMKIEVIKNEKYVYSDGGIACPNLNESDTITGAINNPRVIIEVTSSDSGDYDRGDKLQFYFSLPSLREYLILDQHRPKAALYRRRGEGYLFSLHTYDGVDQKIELKSMDAYLEMSELYADVTFPTDKLTDKNKV